MKNRTVMTQDVQRELNAKTRILFRIFLIVGSVMLLSYIVLSVLLEKEDNSKYFNVYLGGSAIVFALGLVMTISISRTDRRGNSMNECNVMEYELFEDCLTCVTTRNGEQIAEIKVHYRELCKMKETAHYLFLFQTPMTALSIDKTGLSGEEVETLKAWITSEMRKK